MNKTAFNKEKISTDDNQTQGWSIHKSYSDIIIERLSGSKDTIANTIT